MADEKKLKQARAAFDTLCQMLDDNEWNYDKDEEELVITCGVNGEDLPININVRVNVDSQLVSVLSYLPFKIPEDKRAEIAMAISAVNYILADGSFDYNFLDGSVMFRMTSSFVASLISKTVFEYMVMVSCKTMDDFNDKFLMIVKDKIDLQDFINECSGK